MNILHQQKTDHHDIMVVDENNVRKLIFLGDGISQEQSAMDLSNPYTHIFDYTRLVMHSTVFCHEPKKILILGLGGGIIPKHFLKLFPNIEIDIIEIDKSIVQISKQYFDFVESDKVRVFIGDALDFINTLPSSHYDMVILDAYTYNYIPLPLMGLEFIKKISQVINKSGIAVFNVCNAHYRYWSQVKTINKVFKYLYYVHGNQNKLSTMLFGFNKKMKPNMKISIPNVKLRMPHKMGEIDNARFAEILYNIQKEKE